jgi:hypothetical protein
MVDSTGNMQRADVETLQVVTMYTIGTGPHVQLVPVDGGGERPHRTTSEKAVLFLLRWQRKFSTVCTQTLRKATWARLILVHMP